MKANYFAGPRKWGRSFRIPVSSQKVKTNIFILKSVLSLTVVFRRWKKEKEERDLANGINFQYTSPFMSDNASLLKA